MQLLLIVFTHMDLFSYNVAGVSELYTSDPLALHYSLLSGTRGARRSCIQTRGANRPSLGGTRFFGAFCDRAKFDVVPAAIARGRGVYAVRHDMTGVTESA